MGTWPIGYKVLRATSIQKSLDMSSVESENLVATLKKCANLDESTKLDKDENCQFCRYRRGCLRRFDDVSEREVITNFKPRGR